MSETSRKPAGAVIRNIAEVRWEELPGHHGGANDQPPRGGPGGIFVERGRERLC